MPETFLPTSRPPWTEKQVCSLNEFQVSGVFHPFTCGRCRDADETWPMRDEHLLVAVAGGWICPTCDYTQSWAWGFMANDEWRKHSARLDGLEDA